jgi:hypothetical protein
MARTIRRGYERDQVARDGKVRTWTHRSYVEAVARRGRKQVRREARQALDYLLGGTLVEMPAETHPLRVRGFVSYLVRRDSPMLGYRD